MISYHILHKKKFLRKVRFAYKYQVSFFNKYNFSSSSSSSSDDDLYTHEKLRYKYLNDLILPFLAFLCNIWFEMCVCLWNSYSLDHMNAKKKKQDKTKWNWLHSFAGVCLYMYVCVHCTCAFLFFEFYRFQGQLILFCYVIWICNVC